MLSTENSVRKARAFDVIARVRGYIPISISLRIEITICQVTVEGLLMSLYECLLLSNPKLKVAISLVLFTGKSDLRRKRFQEIIDRLV